MTTTDPVLLLGAGASAEAGVPTSFLMTEQLVKRFNKQAPFRETTQALNFVCGALVAHDAAKGSSPYEGLDVERVFSAVELLAGRHALEVTPFVAAWQQAVDAWDRPRVPPDFDAAFRASVARESGFSIGDTITELIRSVTGTDSTSGSTYRELTEQMIQELRGLLMTVPKAVYYLAPLVEAVQQSGGLTVATLNYDLSIEQAAESRGLPSRDRHPVLDGGPHLALAHERIEIAQASRLDRLGVEDE